MTERPPRLPGQEAGSFFVAVGLSVLLAAAAILRREPPAPKPSDAPSSEFSAGRAREVLRRLVGDGAPHPVGSEAHARVRDRVLAELERTGLAPSIQRTFVCGRAGACANVENVLARLPGETQGKAVLLSAHYDSVGAGPGASDDGMAVAAALEIARILKQAPASRNSVIILIDDGEEAGLLGAEAFASAHPWAREIGAVVNMDNRGTSGASFLFETSDQNSWLVDLAARSISRPATSSLFYTIYKALPNDTDLTVFREHGMAGVNFAAIGDEPRYHTPQDDFENASARTLQHHGENALAMTRSLAACDLEAPHRGNAVFFDLFGAAVARWPERETATLAGGTCLLLAAGVLLQHRAGLLSIQSLLRGLIGGLAIPILAAASGFGASRLLRAAGALAVPWIAHPAWLLSTVWSLALLSAGLVATLLARAHPRGLWNGVWIWSGVFSLLLAFAAPGISFLFLVPAAGAALSGLMPLRSTIWRGVAFAAPAALAAFFWLPIAWLLYDALGRSAAVIVAAAIGLWAAGVAPAFLLLSSRSRRGILGALAGAAGIALVGAMLAWPSSPDVPERMPIAWHEDAATRAARWLLFPESARLPETTREAAGCSKAPVSPFPWISSSAAFVAPAAQGNLPPPELLVVEDARGSSWRRVRAVLRSPRAAPVLLLAVPPAMEAARITIGGRRVEPVRGRRSSWASGWRVFSCLTTPPEGIAIEIFESGGPPAPIDLYAGDRSQGLPAGGERLARARGASAVPSQDGDVTVVTRHLRI